MDLPIKLKAAIENQAASYSSSELKKIAQEISNKYRTESGQGNSLVISDKDALVYSCVRMPATFGAVHKALSQSLINSNYKINSLLDVGAGSGTASWVADSFLSLNKVICLERVSAMKELGKQLMQSGTECLKNATWINADIVNSELQGYASDLVISSYVLNELNETNLIDVLNKLWDLTKVMLLIVEPGTQTGFSLIKRIRHIMIEKGAHIIAPCAHEKECRLNSADWCHFSCRVSRSKLHKLLKDGDVPYEDEKFSYLSLVKDEVINKKNRVLRHPIILKGQIKLSVCGVNENSQLTIRKSDPNFKIARKIDWGETIDIKLIDK